MKLASLELTNFRQHASRTFDFAPSGITVIQGRNGSGKTGLVHGLHFALTGAVKLDTKEQNISWGSDSGGVVMRFEHNGVVGNISRNLHNARSSLTLGETVVRTASDVNTRFSELFGLNFKAIEPFCFVFQGETTSFLSARPADRVKLLHRLFGTDSFELLHQTLGSELQTFGLVEVPPKSSAELALELAAVGTKLVEASSKQTGLEAALRSLDMVKLSTTLTNISLLESYTNQHNQLYSEEKVKQKTARKEELKYLISANELELEALKKELAEAQSQQSFLVNTRAGIVHLTAQLALRADIEADVVEEMGFIEQMVAPPPFDEQAAHAQTEDLRTRVAQAKAKVAMCEAAVKGFKGGRCAICGTECIVQNGQHTNIADKVAGAEADRNAALAEVDALTKSLTLCIDAWTKASNEQSTYNQLLNARQTNVANYMARLATLPAAQPIPDVSEIDAKLAAIQQVAARQAAASNALVSLGGEYNVLLAYFEAQALSSATLKKYSDMVAGMDKAVVSDLIKKGQETSQQLNQITNSCDLYRMQIDQLTAERNKALKLESTLAGMTKFRAVLEKVRDVIHRDNLPKNVAQNNLQAINTTWNELLVDLDVPFTAHINDEFEVAFAFTSGTGGASSLSGGQMCCASLALIFSIHRLYSNNIGFIVLDEPTYGLDSDHIDRVVEMLQLLNTQAQSADIQIVVVSHEEKMSGFESLITL